MARYRMDDGTIVDTDKAADHWDEARDWDGQNHIGRCSGSQWTYETLYRSRKGRYYVEHTSQWQGSRPHVEWVSPQEATRWMLLNDVELPEDLRVFANEIEE